MRKTTALLALVTLLGRAAAADPVATVARRPAPANYAGLDFIGFLGFLRLNAGSFELHYERVLGRHQGVQLAGDFVHVHQPKSYAQSHQWTFGGSLSYRYYLGEGDGVFFGARIGYRRGFGKFENEETGTGRIDFTNRQFRLLALIGHRLSFPSARLAVTSRLGLGYGKYTVTSDDGRTDSAARDAARFSRDNLGTLPLAVELELSLAYAF